MILYVTPKQVITSSTLVAREKAMIWLIDGQQNPGTLISKRLIQKFTSLFKAKGKKLCEVRSLDQTGTQFCVINEKEGADNV